jgi:hypothetical protein
MLTLHALGFVGRVSNYFDYKLALVVRLSRSSKLLKSSKLAK